MWWCAWALAAEIELQSPSSRLDSLDLLVGGFLQPRADWTPQDEDAGTTGEVGWSLQRVRFETGLRAEVGDLFLEPRYSLELMPEARLQDAYVDAGLNVAHLRIGQFKAPVSRTFLTSDQNILLAEQAMFVEWIPRRDMGASLRGAVGQNLVEYEVGVFNGEGTNRLGNVNRKFLYAGRLVLSPLGGPGTGAELHRDWADAQGRRRATFSLGSAVHRNEVGEEGEQEGALGLSFEGYFHYRWLNLQVETLNRWIDYENVDIVDYVQRGWYVQTGFFPPGVPWAREHLALVGRYEQGDSLVAEGVPAAGPTDPTQASRRITVGAGLYLGEDLLGDLNDLRMVLEWRIKEELEGFPLKDDGLALAANLTF